MAAPRAVEIFFAILLLILVLQHKRLEAALLIGAAVMVRRGMKAVQRKRAGVISDEFSSLDEVQRALRQRGLESSNLIVAVDLTKSNEWNGEHSFGGRCLHDVRNLSDVQKATPNPYQEVIATIGRTLESFDDDRLIPIYGFGDVSTQDRGVAPFLANHVPHGFDEVLDVYTRVARVAELSGPTNFAPAIYHAMEIVRENWGYHILVIICDGQVVSKAQTLQAIKDASHFPISIIIVGVGDGPWGEMEHYDDLDNGRQFDNVQFCDFDKVTRGRTGAQRDASFALHALMEVPEQFRIIRDRGLLEKPAPDFMPPVPVSPPVSTELAVDAWVHVEDEAPLPAPPTRSGLYPEVPSAPML